MVDVIGRKLRELRQANRMTLKQVAKKAGCTESYISQLENGNANPSIATLKKIAAVFNVQIVDFFIDHEEESPVVVKKDERIDIEFKDGGKTHIQSMVKNTKNKRMVAFYTTIEPGGGSSGLYSHIGEEFGLILSGEMELTIEDKTYYLKEGDSFYFSSARPHGFANKGPDDVVVAWVVSPPTF